MLQDPMSAIPQAVEYVSQVVAEKTATLVSLADGADLLVAGMTEQEAVAKVAEYYRVPLAALHFFPPQILHHGIPRDGRRRSLIVQQRRALGLPDEPPRASRTLEIQAYDEICIPGLAAEWADRADRRPFVGALTLQLPTDADEDVRSWISGGSPPVYFGFGSMPMAAPNDTVAVISAACARVDVRALICLGANYVDGLSNSDQVKVVREVNHATRVSGLPCRRAPRRRGNHRRGSAGRRREPGALEWAGSAGMGGVRRASGSRFRTTLFGVDAGFPHRGSARDPRPRSTPPGPGRSPDR